MYPKVFTDYMQRHKTYAPVRTLPTKTFLMNGTWRGNTAEIDPGKTLEIRLQAVGETTDDGEVKAFFELNGQPRVIRVPNRIVKATTAAKPKAELGTQITSGHRCQCRCICCGSGRTRGAKVIYCR